MNLVLYGFMATGKTTVGKILSQKLSYGFIDVDQIIEEETGITISKIFKEQGESSFRDLEKKTVQRVAKLDKQVIACGGGAVLDPVNVKFLKLNSKFILLKASVDEIMQRTRNDTTRPLIQGKDPKNKIINLLKNRQRVYNEIADLTIETTNKDPKNIVMEIIENLELTL